MNNVAVKQRASVEDTVEQWYASVGPMCVARLREAHEPRTGLFSRQLRDGRWDATGDAEAATSTAICLIGLSRAGIDLDEIGADAHRSMEAIGGLGKRFAGGAGLAIWASATRQGPRYHVYVEPHGGVRAMLPALTTMEVAWLLSGLLHEELRGGSGELRRDIDATIAELLRRQGKPGLFAHAGNAARLSDRLRSHVANFADQIYAVQALAFAAINRGGQETLDAARRCADALLARRGPQHQWWWHYHPGTGSVSRYYPVYSVHQHGMAPMAFMTLGAAGKADYRDRAWAGLDWLRRNELSVSMVDESAGTIWRDIQIDENALAKRWRDARELLGGGEDHTSQPRLRLNRETRPYEWGWCLLAGAMLNSRRPAEHIA